MKTVAIPFAALLVLPFICHSADNPRPAFIPGVPPVSKQIADYTPADVFGALVTTELPAGHPLSTSEEIALLQTAWPGAKQEESIDTLCQIVLDSPPTSQEGGRLPPMVLEMANNNLKYLIVRVVYVSDAQKVDTVLRVVNAQNDPIKIKRAKRFAASMFNQLMDPRVLEFLKEELSDDSVRDLLRGEEGGALFRRTVRGVVFRQLADALASIGLDVGKDVPNAGEEAVRCDALSTWFAAHRPEITTKCAEARADTTEKGRQCAYPLGTLSRPLVSSAADKAM